MKSMQVRKVSYSDQQAKLDAFRVSQNIHFKLYLNLRFSRHRMANSRFRKSERVCKRSRQKSMFQRLITSEGACLVKALHRLSFRHRDELSVRGRAGSPVGEHDSQICPLHKAVTSIHSHLLWLFCNKPQLSVSAIIW